MQEKSDTNPASQLGDMPTEEFRKYGHQLVDWIADYLQNIERYPVLPAVKPGDLRRSLPPSPPVNGEPMNDILADVDRLIMPAMTHWNHPRFHAYFNTSASSPGILGELLSAALNGNAMVWQSGPAVTELEEVSSLGIFAIPPDLKRNLVSFSGSNSDSPGLFPNTFIKRSIIC